MGMTGHQVLWRVEVPNALPLIISGIRSAMLQIVATATIAAYVSLGGLGRFIIDGRAQRDYPRWRPGAVLVGCSRGARPADGGAPGAGRLPRDHRPVRRTPRGSAPIPVCPRSHACRE
jgi:hypothetical protein